MLKNLFGYTATIYMSTLATSALTFIVTLLIPTVLGTEALGKYALFLVVISLGGTISGFGLNRTIVKFLGERSVDGRRLMRLAFAVAGGATAVTVLTAVLGWDRLGPVYALGIVCVGPSLSFEFSSSFFRARFEQRKEALLMILTSASTSVMTVVLMVTTKDELSPIYAGTFTWLATMVGLLLYFRLKRDVLLEEDVAADADVHRTPTSAIWRFTRPLWLGSIIGLIAQGADRFVLEHFAGYAVLGEYFLALRFFDLIERPLGIYSKALLAGFSTDKAESWSHYTKLTTLNLMALPTVVLIMQGAVPIFVSIVISEPMPQLPILFALIGTSVVLKSVEVANNVMTVAHDYPYANQQKQLISSLVTIPTMILLVMWLGAYGAAVSVVVYWTLATFVHVFYMRRILPEFTAFSTPRCLASLALFGALTFVISWFNLYAFSVVSAAAYLVAGSLLGIWDWDELTQLGKAMLSALQKRRRSRSATV